MGVRLTGRFYHHGFVGYRGRGAALTPWMGWSANATTLTFPQRPTSSLLDTSDLGNSSLWFSNSYTEANRLLSNAISTSATMMVTNDPIAASWVDNDYTTTALNPVAYPASSEFSIAFEPSPSSWFDLNFETASTPIAARPNSAVSDNTP